MPSHLSEHHRNTVGKIFAHPTSGNVEWREVISLLEAVGDTEPEHDGKVKVSLGPETEVLHRPHGKDIDVQTVLDLRRMLAQAGLAPDGEGPVADERTRDYRDSRWGKPT